ncbi:MAG: F0F1 ATP synthase subunit delta [Treponema sp.]|jgi:F-type H+-transporting ATPase subunit delta|nr:F0F1 ATP synthase subunit delta [Treponema sp.]
MFIAERFAQAFVRATTTVPAVADDTVADGAAAAEGLEFIKALSPVIRSVRGDVSGTAAAAQLEEMVRSAYGNSALPRNLELALCLVLLLIKKNLFRHIDQVIAAIEQELDTLRGILQVHLEAAQSLEKEFLEDLKRALMKKTGATGIKLDTVEAPELLAGYRLRIGSESIDASLRAQIKQLGTELAEAGGF